MSLSNPFAQLKSLLAGPPLQTGTVVSIADGIALVQLPSGAEIRARGDATPGQTVFLRGDVIEGEAPALAVVFIEI